MTQDLESDRPSSEPQPSSYPAGASPARHRLGRRIGDLVGTMAAVAVLAVFGYGLFVQLSQRAQEAEEARALNLAAFDQTWGLIRDHHFEPARLDPEEGGLDWEAVRRELRPRMERTRSREQGREVLREMLGRLEQSHFALLSAETLTATDYQREAGTLGLDLRILEGRAIVTSVVPGSPSATAGIEAGWDLLRAAGQDVPARIDGMEGQVPPGSRHRMVVTDRVRGLLTGPVGGSRALVFADGAGAPRSFELELATPPGRLGQAGELPAAYVRFETEERADGIRYLTFDSFVYPAYLMRAFNEALESSLTARGLVIDLRGNSGGMLEMVTGMLSWLTAEPAAIGTMRTRDGALDVKIRPRLETYAGPVAVLIDELALSGAELFAQGVRSLGRGVLVGATTSGGVQGGRIETLATGDALMFAVSEFRTPEGERLEGVGVVPDLEVGLTRQDLLAGRDPVLEAAVQSIESQSAPVASAASPVGGRRPAPISLDEAPPPAVDPEAARVLDRFVEVTGGSQAYRQLTSRVLRGSLRLGGERGIPMTVTIHQAVGGRSRIRVESDYMGPAVVGSDGRRAWREDLFAGPQWLGPGETVAFLRDFRLDGPANWRLGLSRVEYRGLEEVDGRSRHHLRLESRRGQPLEQWYDAESGLLERVVTRTPGLAGGPDGVPAVHEVGDYREAGGILLPFRSRFEVLGVERRFQVEEVEEGVPVDPALFTPPEALLAAENLEEERDR